MAFCIALLIFCLLGTQNLAQGFGTVSYTYFIAIADSSCPDVPESSCKTLQDYVDNYTTFRDHSRIIFLPGNHSLLGTLNIRDVSDISLSSMSPLNSATIKCIKNSPAALVIMNCTNVKIARLMMSGCGVNRPEHAALYIRNAEDLNLTNVTIENSIGFGIYAHHCCGSLTIQGSTFSNNKGYAYEGGNAKFLFSRCSYKNTNLTIQLSNFTNGTTLHNSSSVPFHASGLVINGFAAGLRVLLEAVRMADNYGGNLKLDMEDIVSGHWEVSIRHCVLERGNSYSGGGVYLVSWWHYRESSLSECRTSETNMLEVIGTNFTDNTAKLYAGGFMLRFRNPDCMPSQVRFEDCTFSGNTVTELLGHASAIKVLRYAARPKLYANGSGSNSSSMKEVSIVGSRFHYNRMIGNQASVIELGRSQDTIVVNSSFVNNSGTAISMRTSNVYFAGELTFINNNATNGGALKFCDSSVMYLENNTAVVFKNNSADDTGGAIFVQESCQDQRSTCFFQPVVGDNTTISDINITLAFNNNSANRAGDSIYGARIDNCFLIPKLSFNSNLSYFWSKEVFNTITDFTPHNTLSEISSRPFRVLFCNLTEQYPIINVSHFYVHKMSVIPGKKANISLVAAGQRFGTVPATIAVDIGKKHKKDSSIDHENFVLESTLCDTKNFSLKTSSAPGTEIELFLSIQNGGSYSAWTKIYWQKVIATIEPCPWGFTLDNETGMCVCFINSKATCDLEHSAITVDERNGLLSWIGCQRAPSQSVCNYNDSFLHAKRCRRLDRCQPRPSINGSNVDDQCVEKRTGILCGSCVKEYSVVLGTGKCKKCPESYAYLSLIVVYLAAGIILVILLTKLKFTVSSGCMNSLIYYANLVHWDRHHFFPHFLNADIVRLIIAWLNLDFGIEVCFYNGLSVYWLIWLQIGFILYIILLQIIIIILCRKYIYFTRFFGENVTKVISTLAVLLFSKVLYVSVDIFDFTSIHNPINDTVLHVLSTDGNIQYASREHIPLIIIGSIFAAFIALFTSSLLFIQLLTRISSVRCFTWVARLQPFFETITGPCNSMYAFWPGFLFLIRITYAMVQVNTHDLSKFGNATIIAAAVPLLLSFVGPIRVYKRTMANVFEFMVLVNLAITAAFVEWSSTTSSVILSHISVCLVIVTFLAVHVNIFQQLKRWWRLLVRRAASRRQNHQEPENRRLLQDEVTHSEIAIAPTGELLFPDLHMSAVTD